MVERFRQSSNCSDITGSYSDCDVLVRSQKATQQQIYLFPRYEVLHQISSLCQDNKLFSLS